MHQSKIEDQEKYTHRLQLNDECITFVTFKENQPVMSIDFDSLEGLYSHLGEVFFEYMFGTEKEKEISSLHELNLENDHIYKTTLIEYD